jgi:shikimate kinase
MKYPSILFISGASGVGKTSIVQKLQTQYCSSDNYTFLHFDSIGIPSVQEMIEQAGSGERWQELTTLSWIEKITIEYHDKKIVVIEGQANLDFIDAACRHFEIANYSIVLIHCDWEVMKERLVCNRQQPELVNQNMKDWSIFLLKQVQNKNLPIVDTTYKTLEESMESINRVLLQTI